MSFYSNTIIQPYPISWSHAGTPAIPAGRQCENGGCKELIDTLKREALFP